MARWQKVKASPGRNLFVGVQLAAQLLGATRQCIYGLIWRKRVTAFKYKGKQYVDLASLEAWTRAPWIRGGRAPIRAWTTDEEQLLGSKADDDVARMLRRSKSDVTRRRRQLGILLAGWRSQTPWTKEREALLGTAADSAIGLLVGVTASCVAQRRRMLGIPAYRIAKHVAWVETGRKTNGFFRWHA